MSDSSPFGGYYGYYDSMDGYFKVYEADYYDDRIVTKFYGDFVNYEEAIDSLGKVNLVESQDDILNLLQ